MKILKKILNITIITATLILVPPMVSANSNQLIQAVTINHHHTKYISDSLITMKVKKKLSQSPILNPFVIQVITENWIVYLKGVVDTNIQYEEAIALAESTENVVDVDTDGLLVKNSKESLHDSYITAKIKGALLRTNLEGTNDSVLKTHVETKNGIVYLSGTVENKQQAENAVKVARSIEGVKKIRSSFKIQN